MTIDKKLKEEKKIKEETRVDEKFEKLLGSISLGYGVVGIIASILLGRPIYWLFPVCIVIGGFFYFVGIKK